MKWWKKYLDFREIIRMENSLEIMIGLWDLFIVIKIMSIFNEFFLTTNNFIYSLDFFFI